MRAPRDGHRQRGAGPEVSEAWPARRRRGRRAVVAACGAAGARACTTTGRPGTGSDSGYRFAGRRPGWAGTGVGMATGGGARAWELLKRNPERRTSGEYLFEELIALSSQVIDSPVNPVQFT